MLREELVIGHEYRLRVYEDDEVVNGVFLGFLPYEVFPGQRPMEFFIPEDTVRSRRACKLTLHRPGLIEPAGSTRERSLDLIFERLRAPEARRAFREGRMEYRQIARRQRGRDGKRTWIDLDAERVQMFSASLRDHRILAQDCLKKPEAAN